MLARTKIASVATIAALGFLGVVAVSANNTPHKIAQPAPRLETKVIRRHGKVRKVILVDPAAPVGVAPQAWRATAASAPARLRKTTAGWRPKRAEPKAGYGVPVADKPKTVGSGSRPVTTQASPAPTEAPKPVNTVASPAPTTTTPNTVGTQASPAGPTAEKSEKAEPKEVHAPEPIEPPDGVPGK